MATIDSVIIDARWDLRDPDSTLFTDDAELLAYANRALFQLDNVLSAEKSDWVYNEATLSILIATNSVATPAGCIAIRSAWIGENELPKITPEEIYRERKYISGTGQPYYFSEMGQLVIFDRTTDAGYTVEAYYDKRATALVTGAPMPYGDEFNGLIREMIVMLGHKRNENDMATDAQIYNFFYERVFGNVLRRKHTKKRYQRLDF